MTSTSLGFIGAVLGWLTNYFIQERFYQRSLERGHGKAVPEVRLYSSAIGGLLFAAGCFCLYVSCSASADLGLVLTPGLLLFEQRLDGSSLDSLVRALHLYYHRPVGNL